MQTFTLKALLKEIIASKDSDVALNMLREYNKDFVQKELGYGLYFYDGYEQDFPNGLVSPVMTDGVDQRRELVSHRIVNISVDNSHDDAIVGIEVGVYSDTKAGKEVLSILKGEIPNKTLRLVSKIQPHATDENKFRIATFDFVAQTKGGTE